MKPSSSTDSAPRTGFALPQCHIPGLQNQGLNVVDIKIFLVKQTPNSIKDAKNGNDYLAVLDISDTS